MLFALLLPGAAIVACGAVELTSITADRQAMQDAADAAALDAADQLGVANTSGVTTRATQFAMNPLQALTTRETLTPGATVASDNKTITVTVAAHRPSFFGDLLPYGGWNFKVASTAVAVQQTPLCVLTTSTTGNGAAGGLVMSGSSQLTAPACLVQSNADINVTSPAQLTASTVQAVGSAAGQITPTPQTGAPPIPDPFVNVNFSTLGVCNPLDVVYAAGVNFITPGLHCGVMRVNQNATVELMPGEHYFAKGGLQLQANATLEGDDVVLIFDNSSQFTFQDDSQIKLQGRRSGQFAGFVIATPPANRGVFTISSSAARLLLGTIYIPGAELNVSGINSTVADQSAWTVIIAKSLKVQSAANLVINASYAGSTVPVPGGLGPRSGARLLH